MTTYVNPPATATPITGRGLGAACMKASPLERAVLGAQLHVGKFELEHPTPAQAAELVHTTPYLVRLAIQLIDRPDLLYAVQVGYMTLHEAAKHAVEPSHVAEAPAAPPVVEVTPVTLTPVVPEVLDLLDDDNEDEAELIADAKTSGGVAEFLRRHGLTSLSDIFKSA